MCFFWWDFFGETYFHLSWVLTVPPFIAPSLIFWGWGVSSHESAQILLSPCLQRVLISTIYPAIFTVMEWNDYVHSQQTATHCNTLQHLQHKLSCLVIVMGWNVLSVRFQNYHQFEMNTCSRSTLQRTATHCNTLQHTATHCTTLQHTATHCKKLQHTATHCNTLQHTATRTV